MSNRLNRVLQLFSAGVPAPAVCAEHIIIDEQRVSDYAAICGHTSQGNQRQRGNGGHHLLCGEIGFSER